MSEVLIVKNLFKLIRLLDDGKIHSGENIADLLSVSRGNVWHYINLLEEQKLIANKILRVRGKGYQLAERIDFLNQNNILERLSEKNQKIIQLEIIDQIDSTNTTLSKQISESLDNFHGKVLVAERQTQGRGRRGKTWIASLGSSLTFSVAWKFEKGASQLSGLSLVVGLAIAKALDSLGVSSLLKWPNDLLINFCKLGGILIELQGDFSGPCYAIIGIGLNIKLNNFIKEDIDQPVTDIFSHLENKNISRNEIFSTILNQLFDDLNQFEQHGFRTFKDEWLKYHAFQNKKIKVIQADGEKITFGQIIDIDDFGHLRIQTDQGVEAIFSGEVSLRLDN